MNVLVVPMFAKSRMGGPWSRAQAIAAAFNRAGHRVVLAMADDGNCTNPCVREKCKLPVPSPLGLPPAIASRTFPVAEKVGISGRRPVESFEEVLWLTGALAYDYVRESVSALCDAMVAHCIDVVYSEYNISAIIAARALGTPVFGSFSYTTQTSYASDPDKAEGVRRFLHEAGLPDVSSSLELFDWLEHRFIPSCRELEPFEDEKTDHVGFLRELPKVALEGEGGKRDCVVVYLGAGSVPNRKIKRVVTQAFDGSNLDVYVAGSTSKYQKGSVRFAPRFDFAKLLPRACCFVHHGGQNSTMDALAYGAPQVIVPGRVFERIYNANSIERVGAGVKLSSFDAESLRSACCTVRENPSYVEESLALRRSLASLGGADRIVTLVGR